MEKLNYSIIAERINNGYYRNTDSFPNKPKKPKVADQKFGSIHIDQLPTSIKELARYQAEMAEYELASAHWCKISSENKLRFKADIEGAYDHIRNNPKVKQLHYIVWDRGHVCGYHSILELYEMLHILIK